MWSKILYHFYGGRYHLKELKTSLKTTRKQTSRSFEDIARAVIGERINANVYTDGACSSNGSTNAKGGIGVFFGEGDFRNISEPQPCPPYTNNRSELIAIERVFEYIISNENITKELYSSVTIHTDSMYSINSISGKTNIVQNVELIMRIRQKLANSSKIIPVELKYIAGHRGNYGNVQADKLATDGAKKI